MQAVFFGSTTMNEQEYKNFMGLSSIDVSSRPALLFHIKRLCKEQGKNFKGFSKMPIKQLKAVYYSLNQKQK